MNRVMNKRKRGPMEDQVKKLTRQVTRREAKGILYTCCMLKPGADGVLANTVAYAIVRIRRGHVACPCPTTMTSPTTSRCDAEAF